MDTIFNYMQKYDYENLFFCQDKGLNFKAVIAIHDTTLGPATGGCRMWNRYDSEMDAVEDALRLARGMTYKYAAAGVNLVTKSQLIWRPIVWRKNVSGRSLQ